MVTASREASSNVLSDFEVFCHEMNAGYTKGLASFCRLFEHGSETTICCQLMLWLRKNEVK